jgi:ABC-type phosphate transport system ATPase subunit
VQSLSAALEYRLVCPRIGLPVPISIPKLSLVVLIGPSGSGKSTFARKRFRPTEVVSSDACRDMVCDDETS